MISREMYILLKRIPRIPEHKTIKELRWTRFRKDLRKSFFYDEVLFASLLNEAVSQEYVIRTGKDTKSVLELRLHLTEKGSEAVEEYREHLSSSWKSNLAIVLSVLSFLISLGTFLGWSVH